MVQYHFILFLPYKEQKDKIINMKSEYPEYTPFLPVVAYYSYLHPLLCLRYWISLDHNSSLPSVLAFCPIQPMVYTFRISEGWRKKRTGDKLSQFSFFKKGRALALSGFWEPLCPFNSLRMVMFSYSCQHGMLMQTWWFSLSDYFTLHLLTLFKKYLY